MKKSAYLIVATIFLWLFASCGPKEKDVIISDVTQSLDSISAGIDNYNNTEDILLNIRDLYVLKYGNDIPSFAYFPFKSVGNMLVGAPDTPNKVRFNNIHHKLDSISQANNNEYLAIDSIISPQISEVQTKLIRRLANVIDSQLSQSQYRDFNCYTGELFVLGLYSESLDINQNHFNLTNDEVANLRRRVSQLYTKFEYHIGTELLSDYEIQQLKSRLEYIGLNFRYFRTN